MPRVKLNTPEVDSLNSAKRRVNRKNKIKYAGEEVSAPQVREDTQRIYSSILEKLNGVVASIGEINSQLVLTAGINAPWASKAIDRYISATSSSKKQIADLNSFLESNSASLTDLSEAQLSAISLLQRELEDTFRNVVVSVNKLSPKRSEAIKKVFSVFVDDLVRLNQLLQGSVGFRTGITGAESGIPVKPFKDKPISSPRKKKPVSPILTETDEPETPVRRSPRKRLKMTDTPEPRLGRDAEISGGGETHTHADGTVMTGKTHTKASKVIFDPHSFIDRRMPISFPAMMRKETQGGVFLSSENYMPTRFL